MTFFRVRSVNTATDSENRIHTDRTAEEYGFSGGLVPGVTLYGYMAQAAMEHFGPAWLECGSMSLRLRRPVYDSEDLTVESREAAAGELEILLNGDRASASARMEPLHPSPLRSDFAVRQLPSAAGRELASKETLAPGTILGTLTTTIDLASTRLSQPFPAAIGDHGQAHPAVLLNLANEILMKNFVLGPWVHVASELSNYAAALDGTEVEVRARVAEQYERRGHEFTVIDVLTAAKDHLVQYVRHTVIWKLSPARLKDDARAAV